MGQKEEEENDPEEYDASDAAAETAEWKCRLCTVSAAELWRQEGTDFWFCAACWESEAGETAKEEVHTERPAKERFTESPPVVTPVREVGPRKRDDHDACCETAAARQDASHTPDAD